jgi:tetratricopeptide (TPR) repeat protein
MPALVVSLILGAAWQYRINQSTSTDRRQAGRTDSASIDITTNLEADSHAPSKSDAQFNAEKKQVTNDSDQVSIQNAQSLIDRGFAQEGAAMLEKLIEADPANTQALMEMAMVYTLDLKEPQKSRQLLERILDINPQHRAALNELELLYKELDAVEDGLAWLAQKAEQYPESLEIQYVYGRMLASSDPNAAIPWLQRATFIDDQKEQALDQLAAAALRSGNVALAVKSWAEALSLAETELERAKSSGESGLDYLEDRIAATRMELSKARAQLNGTSRQ